MPTKKVPTLQDRQNRKLILNISMYLLAQESLKQLFWSVKKVDFNRVAQTLKIGISTTNGKYGTTLSLLRKNTVGLAQHLRDTGVTFRSPQISFYIAKEEESIQRIYNKLDKILLSN